MLAACGAEGGGDPIVDAGNDVEVDTSGGDTAGDATGDAGGDAGDLPDASELPDGGGVDGDGTDDAGVDGGGDPDCVSDRRFFEEQVQERLIVPICTACHTAQGSARDSELNFVPAVQPDYLERNRAALEHVARLQYEGEPLVLMKPTGRIPHDGGVVVAEGSEELLILEEFVRRIGEPVVCDDEESVVADSLVLLTPVETLRKVSTALRGTLPTADEYASVRSGGESALVDAIDAMMDSPEFYTRLREVYNDLLLTDKYTNGFRNALSLLDSERFPARYYHEWAETEDENNAQRRASNLAVAREPLELIVHVVRDNRPFTEILTADYAVVNDFSAYAYGLRDGDFPNPVDPAALRYREARIPGIPHAGLLTTPAFLARYPSTPTNRNRQRARVFFDRFLATDILALADRPIDPNTSDYLNATRDDPKCSACHALLDPVAGAFQNFGDGGQFDPPADGWYAEMLPPGFGRELLPSDQRTDALGWLAELAIADRRFAIAVVQQIWVGFGGLPLLPAAAPSEGEDIAGRREAYRAQREFFSQVADRFIASEYELRVVIRDVMLAPAYRATGALDDAAAWELADAGTIRPLTPEQLNRRIEQVTGYPWRSSFTSTDALLDRFRLLYGGIDSDGTSRRLTALNGIMVNIAERMAFDVACRTSARDFSLDREARRLFPYVETSYVPETPEGFEIPQAQAAIRENIRFLHAHVLGEELELDDPEIEATWQLYLSIWRDGNAGMNAGTVSRNLPGTCSSTTNFFTGESLPNERRVTADNNYSVRSWMAVMAYLLGDYRFLYE